MLFLLYNFYSIAIACKSEKFETHSCTLFYNAIRPLMHLLKGGKLYQETETKKV